MTCEAAADTRDRKSGHGAPDLVTRWHQEAARRRLDRRTAARRNRPRLPANLSHPCPVTVGEVVSSVSDQHSSWGRPDVKTGDL